MFTQSPQIEECKINSALSLIEGSFAGHTKIVSYLLEQSSKYLTEENIVDIFKFACRGGDTEMIKLLANKAETKEILSQSNRNDEGFIKACMEGYLDIVKYILTSNLKDSIGSGFDRGFIEAAKFSNFESDYPTNSLHIVNYFLYDLNYQIDLDKRYSIQNVIKEDNFEKLMNLVDKRDLFIKINEELCEKIQTRKPKI